MKQALLLSLMLWMGGRIEGQVPQLLSFQGRIMIANTNFEGTGRFKFALVKGDGAQTFWSNDGSSVGGGEPAAAVSLPVNQGLYSVLLGDAASMRIIPAALFTNSDVRLRVWFSDGAGPFEQLQPDQRLAAVGYALMAHSVVDGSITSDKLAPGAVTAASLGAQSITAEKIAPGAIRAAHIASNSISGQQLADGSVGHSALARPYEAGRVTTWSESLPAGSTGTAGGSLVTVPFPQPFRSEPLVVIHPDNTGNAAAANLGLQLVGQTSSNFTVRVEGGRPSISTVYQGAAAVSVESRSSFGKYNSAAMIGGKPAFSAYDETRHGLVFMRARDAAGTSWHAPILVDATPGSGLYTSLAEVGGMPAISYINETSHSLRFARALDAEGATWGAPVTVVAGDVGNYTSLASIGGAAAITYTTATDGSLRYIRATSAAGTSWNTSILLESAVRAGYLNLRLISGRPAVTYHDGQNGHLKYLRANDANGAAWPAPTVVHAMSMITNIEVTVSHSSLWGMTVTNYHYTTNIFRRPVGAYASLEIVNGHPAIAYYLDATAVYSVDRPPPAVSGLAYVRALDADGNAWGTPVTVALGEIYSYTRSGLLGSTTTYYDTQSTDAGRWGVLKVVNGSPAILFRGTEVNPRTRVTTNFWGTAETITYNDAKFPLKYVRAQDALGQQWGAASKLPADSVSHTALFLAEGRPACAYYQSDLRMLRAEDASGSQWPAQPVPVQAEALLPSGLVGQVTPSDGLPVAAFYDAANSKLKAIKAADEWGTAWSSQALILDGKGQIGLESALLLMNNTPFMVYRDNLQRRLMQVFRDGAGWTQPLAIDLSGQDGRYPALLKVTHPKLGDAILTVYYAANEQALCFAFQSSQGRLPATRGVIDGNCLLPAAPSLIMAGQSPAVAYLSVGTAGAQLKFARAISLDGLSWSAPALVRTLDLLIGDPGMVSLSMVAGAPAIAFTEVNTGLQFVRAQEISGLTWNSPVKVDVSPGGKEQPSLRVVNGRPAIAYHDAARGRLQYVRAADPSGLAWGAPVELDASSADAGECPSLVLWDNRPAVIYWDKVQKSVKNIQAADKDGSSWHNPQVAAAGDVGYAISVDAQASAQAFGFHDAANGSLKYAQKQFDWTAQTVYSGPSVGQFLSLALVNHRPGISYHDASGKRLKFVMGNPTGTSWGSPVVVDANPDTGYYSSLAEVNGKPAIAYYDARVAGLFYAQALSTNGAAWKTRYAVDTNLDAGRFASLARVQGRPAIAYFAGGDSLRYVRAADADGASWPAPQLLCGGLTPRVTYETQMVYGVILSVQARTNHEHRVLGHYASLAVVGHRPAVAFQDAKNGDLGYIAALDAEGSSWGDPVFLDTADVVGQYITLRELGGAPAICYYDSSKGNLKMIRARDSRGTHWDEPIVLDSQGDVGRYAFLAKTSQDRYNILYLDSDHRRLRSYSPMVQLRFTWFAVEP